MLMKIYQTAAILAACAVLAGCQGAGREAANAGGAPAAAPAAAAQPAAAPTGDMAATCAAQAAQKFGARPDDIATSNDYPYLEGNSVDGSAARVGGPTTLFRCDFTREGAFVRVAEVPNPGQ